ncbi:MAG: glycosyltransferase family 39 protein [Anaerolineae bacterium]|nr:glycosyltransferase family 39 protein [Anaerolineae bacterium]
MINIKNNARIFWGGLIFVFLLTLLPRALYPVTWPMQWYERSVQFWDALLTGDLKDTYQQYHPGVTTMWIAGLGIRGYALVQGWSGSDLLNFPPHPLGVTHHPVYAGVIALNLVIAACVSLIYVLLTRLTNWPVAFCAGCFLALDPFYIAESQNLHIDALLATFMFVSALFILCYVQQQKRQYLIFSGIFAGLSFLTKTPSIFLFPYTFCALTVVYLFSGRWGNKSAIWQSRLHPSPCTCQQPLNVAVLLPALGRAARSFGIWLLVVCIIFILLWPAMWVDPIGTLSKVFYYTFFWSETPHGNPTFFAGQLTFEDPGVLYYLAALVWHATTITLPLYGISAVCLLRCLKKYGTDDKFIGWVLLYAVGFLILMSLMAKKTLRYLVPIYVALDVLVGWTAVYVAQSIGYIMLKGRIAQKLKSTSWIPFAVSVLLILLQAGVVFRSHPYYGSHHNLLLGGGQVAQHVLPLGDKCEGVDLAARVLNEYPGAEQWRVGVDERCDAIFKRDFVGETCAIDDPSVGYRVFAINHVQRELHADQWRDILSNYQVTEPFWSVAFEGVPYAWIYQTYVSDPSLFPIQIPLNAQLGDQIHLLGYQMNTLSVGNPLTVTLYWQAEGHVPQDYNVFVHGMSEAGQLVAQHDGVPVDGTRPLGSWYDREIIKDVHILYPPQDTLAHIHTVFVGMYDWTTGIRARAVDAAGIWLAEDRIELAIPE